MPKKKPPELTFQDHIAAFLVREHGYALLARSAITDTEHYIAEDHLWTFLTKTQGEALKRLALYGSDTRGEVLRALRSALRHTPLWVLIRQGLEVRGLDLRLYYPKPRSSESEAVQNYPHNRISVLPHCYFGDANQEIDFVFFLNGLPIVDLELKHEKNQNVHHAVAQYVTRDHRITERIIACLGLSRADPNPARRLRGDFDLITGASTGDIIAIGLGLGLTAAAIRDFYRTRGPAIFPGTSRLARAGGILRWFVRPKFSHAALRTELSTILGERRFGGPGTDHSRPGGAAGRRSAASDRLYRQAGPIQPGRCA